MNVLIVSIIFFASFNLVLSDNVNRPKEDEVDVRNLGKSAKIEDVPWFGFFIKYNNTALPALCNGAIIHAKWVLTTVRCIDRVRDTTLEIIFQCGQTSLAVNTEQSYRHQRYLDLYIKNPNYQLANRSMGRRGYSVHDIGLVKLEKSLDFGPGRQPIVLANNNFELYDYRFASVIDWDGSGTGNHSISWPGQVRKSRICIIEEHECILRSANMIMNSDLHICGFDPNGFIQTCPPDEGSLLVLKNTLIGVLTFGDEGCALDNWRPTVFTRVSTHLSWIEKKLAENGDTLPNN